MSGSKILLFLIGEEKNFELEYRIFNFYCLLGIIISLIMVIIRYYTNLPPILGVLLNIFMLISFGCWYLSRFQRLFRLATFIAAFSLIFVVTPVLWIFNAGSNGGAQYYFVFWGIMVCSVFRGWNRRFWLFLLFIVIGALMYLEYYFPHFVVPYPNATARYIDVYASFATAMVATTSIFIIWTNSYRDEHNHVKEYAERLGEMAVTDGLTNLYNHTYLYQRLEDEIYKAGRYQQKLSLIMVDIDFFKAFNDTYGHPIGDIILEQFAALLRSHIRSSDIAGRYGGEEFLIICPKTDLEGALAITEKLRLLVEQARFGEDKSIVMTISVASPPGAAETADKPSRWQTRLCMLPKKQAATGSKLSDRK
ncbi:MAG: GGDEF domain-containing protein [Syntrophomonadaceae bacterium]|nr:GGDEF domain-containing protein [Syntrophomonadaceae bacterium]